MEFGIKIYGYDPLLSKEEIESFDVKTLDFSFSTGFLFSKKKKCESGLRDCSSGT